MDAATACLAPRIKTMLPRWEATTVACHCVGRGFRPFANSLTVIANVPPAHTQIMSAGVACALALLVGRALAMLLTSFGTVPSKAFCMLNI